MRSKPTKPPSATLKARPRQKPQLVIAPVLPPQALPNAPRPQQNPNFNPQIAQSPRGATRRRHGRFLLLFLLFFRRPLCLAVNSLIFASFRLEKISACSQSFICLHPFRCARRRLRGRAREALAASFKNLPLSQRHEISEYVVKNYKENNKSKKRISLEKKAAAEAVAKAEAANARKP